MVRERVKEYAPDLKSFIYIIFTIAGFFGYGEFVEPQSSAPSGKNLDNTHLEILRRISDKIDELQKTTSENNVNIYNINKLLSFHISDKEIHIPRGEFGAITSNLQKDVDNVRKIANNAENKIDGIVYGKKVGPVNE